MIKRSPNIVFKCKFQLALNHIDRKVKCSEMFAKTNIGGMFNYFSNVKKRAVNMFDYFEGKINKEQTVNLILEDGSCATQEEIDKRKKDYLNYFKDSNLYQCILSFNNDYIDNSIELSNLEKLISKEVMPKFLKYCGFKDINNMSYQLALHTNTKHYHLHISFIEKEPNYISSDGTLKYRRKGMITEREKNFMKREVAHAIDRHRIFTPLVVSSNKQIEELKKYFKAGERNYILKDIDEIVLEENVLNLGRLLYEKRNGKKGKIKYNSINDKEIQVLTKSIKNYLFKNKSSELYKKDVEFHQTLNKINDYFYNINKENNIKKKKYKSDYSIKKEEYLDNYIYNAIVNNASYKFARLKENKKYLSDKEIIHEAVLKVYKKNKKQNKFDILLSYLKNANSSSQFTNKYKVEQSIKKINQEMEEAKDEFSKLFITDDYEK